MSDSLDPVMATGEDQPFQNWIDFLERVARPIVEGDRAAEDAAMGLYRQANPYFICAALVMAANERDRLRATVDDAEYGMARLADEVEDLRARNERLLHDALNSQEEVATWRATVDTTLQCLRTVTDSLRDRGEHTLADDTALAYRTIRLQLDESGERAPNE